MLSPDKYERLSSFPSSSKDIFLKVPATPYAMFVVSSCFLTPRRLLPPVVLRLFSVHTLRIAIWVAVGLGVSLIYNSLGTSCWSLTCIAIIVVLLILTFEGVDLGQLCLEILLASLHLSNGLE